jgi:hypothetical protein
VRTGRRRLERVSAGRLDPEFEPRLVEAAVLEALRGGAAERRFHAERSVVYAIAEPEPREAAFEALHTRWFGRLGLDRPFHGALAEAPAVARGCARWLVVGARGRRDEGADLLVGAGARPNLLARVLPATVAAPAPLLRLLRRELLHVADMLDPAFRYEAALPRDVSGGPRERVVRGNYRVLWDVSVDGRLRRRGVLPAAVRGERLADFARAFPHLGDRTEAAFEAFFDAPRPTHAAMLAFAAGGPGGAPLPRCPLCEMPTRDLEPAPAALPGPILAAIGRDVPAWRPDDGVCRRCAEVYACREGS